MADTKIRVSMILDSKDFSAGMKAAGVSVEEFGKNTEEANTQTKGFSAWLAGGVAGLVASLTTKVLELGQALLSGLAEGAKASVEQFSKFDSAMRSTNTILLDGEEQFGKNKQAVLDLSIEYGKSATEMAQAMFDINSAGFKGAEGMDILAAATKAAIGGQTDIKTAAGGLMTIMQNYGKELGNAATAVDKMAQANNIGRTDVGLLSKAFGDITSTAATLKIPFDDLSAAMTTLTKTTGSSEKAQTQLKNILAQIVTPSKDLREIFEGMTGQTISAYTATHGLNGTLKALGEITGGSIDQLGRLVGSQEAVAGITGLASEKFKSYDQDIKDMARSTGVATLQMDAQNMSMARQVERWKAIKEVLMIEIGDKLAPMLGVIINYASSVALEFKKWLENKDNIAKLNELIEASKTAITMMMNALKDMSTVFAEAFSGGEDAAKKSGSAIDSIIGLVKLLSIGFKMLVEWIKPTVELIGDMARTLGALAEGRWADAMKGAFETVKDVALQAHKTALGVGKAMIQGASEYEATMNKLKDSEIGKAQEAEVKKLKIMQNAEAEAKKLAEKGVEERAKVRQIDVEAFKAEQDAKEKAAKDASKNSLKTSLDSIKEEENAKLESLKKQGNAVADMNAGIKKNTTETMSDTVSKVNASIDKIAKTRAVQVNGSVNGLEALDAIKGGTINVNGNLGSFFDQLDKFLIPRIHADNKAIFGELVKITANTKATADKIPPAARSY